MSESEETIVEMIERTSEGSHSNLMQDVELAIELVKTLKKHLDVSHPSVTSLVRKLLFS
jgi:Mn-dependent DtxR family transcriptional regulator